MNIKELYEQETNGNIAVNWEKGVVTVTTSKGADVYRLTGAVDTDAKTGVTSQVIEAVK